MRSKTISIYRAIIYIYLLYRKVITRDGSRVSYTGSGEHNNFCSESSVSIYKYRIVNPIIIEYYLEVITDTHKIKF